MTERNTGSHAWARSLSALALWAALSSSTSACARAADEASVASVAPATQPSSSDPPQATPLASMQHKQIVETSLTLTAQRTRDARAKFEQRLGELGGFVESLNAEGASVSYHFVVRVPEQRLAALIGLVRGLGSVSNETQQVKDVTREYVDVDARLRNLKRTEERMLALLSERTGSLADVIAIEHELSRVRGESEALTAQLRALEHDVAMATLTVYITPVYTAVEVPDDAFAPVRALWSDAGSVVARSAASLLWVMSAVARTVLALIPWLPVFALLVWTVRRTVRWRARR